MKRYCENCKKKTEQEEYIHWDGAKELACKECGILTYSEVINIGIKSKCKRK